MRARHGGAVLLIDAGDMWQGTLESNIGEGESVVAAYNVLGHENLFLSRQADLLGNHGRGDLSRLPIQFHQPGRSFTWNGRRIHLVSG